MWPFSSTKGNPRWSARVRDLEEDIDLLKRKHKDLDLEFNTLYDKVRHALGRMAKRSAIVEAAQQQEEAPDSLTQGPQEASFTDGLEGLSARQRQINQQILAGRMRRQ